MLKPSEEIREIFERLEKGEKIADVIAPEKLSNMVQAMIHFLDHIAQIDELKKFKK